MLTFVEVMLVVGTFIVPLQTPKKKIKKVVDNNTVNAHYAINEYGCIVKL
jgi:hypothetical protein